MSYYIAIGSAYAQLAGLVSSCRAAATREALATVFDELAQKFGQFVDVLSEIRAGTSFASSSMNLLRLCEEWVRTRDEWLEKRLRASGLVGLDRLGRRFSG